MPITPLKDILFGEQNAVSVSRRSLPTDDELMRRARTDYASSREFVDNSGLMTARVIETPPGLVSPPFSWSILSTETRVDTKLVVVKAHLIEASVAPGYDEDIKTLDGKSITPNSLKMFQYEFVAIHSDLPIPSEGDDIWVDFENRKTLTGPRYHGIKNSVSTNGGVNPALQANNPAAAANAEIQGRATGVAAFGFYKNGKLVTPPSLSATLAKKQKGSSVPVSPITSAETAIQNATTAPKLESIKQNSAFSTKKELENFKKQQAAGQAGSKGSLREIDGKIQYHAGVDIAVPFGTPIYAPLAATVIHLEEIPQNDVNRGIILHIKHDDPGGISGNPPYIRSRYLHLSEVYVGMGAKVAAGQLLGRTGEAGTVGSGGPHLHLESYGPEGLRNCTEKEMELVLNAVDADSYVERKTKEVREKLSIFVKDYIVKRQPYFRTMSEDEAFYIGEQQLIIPPYYNSLEQSYKDVLNLLRPGLAMVAEIEAQHGGEYEENSRSDRALLKEDKRTLDEYQKSKQKRRRTT
jgi:hypothetical protein